MSRFKSILFVLVASFLAIVLARLMNDSSQGAGLAGKPTGKVPAHFQSDEINNIRIFEKVSPSTVFISTIAIRYDFFRRPYESPRGTGTGFIWDKEGHIVTNFHVINQSNKIDVILFDQKVYSATFVGGDIDKDLAVIKIDAPPASLNPILFAKQKKLFVGQKAIAIGNPFGLDNTMTVGIVSALDREIESLSKRKIKGVIQTDAAINPGNSGGPLLNSSGRLIGVNTQIQSTSGSSAGIGFAIPLNILTRVIPQLIKYGKVKRIGLGVLLAPDHYLKRFGFSRGVMIGEVGQPSAAERAGLRGIQTDRFRSRWLPGDIILGINNKVIENGDQLSDIFESHRAGDIVTLHILRNGSKKMNVKIKLQKLN